MKITGIIAEYNPFHNGHLYQIKKARELTGADYIIVVMSGNLTQRGTPALIDKYSRSKMALMGGADLVIELPACYATASAEYFAMGAISILNQLGCVDSICFGSENGDITMLTKIANALVHESEDFIQALKTKLKNGDTYPVARNAALAETINGFTSFDTILGFPNNILGIEYIKGKLKKVSNGAVGIGEGKVIELFLEYLSLDDAYIAAQKAKEDADRKAKAAEKAKQAKGKAKAKNSKAKDKSSKSAKTDKKEDSKPKTSSKKSTAPKAATDESVISLFNMM